METYVSQHDSNDAVIWKQCVDWRGLEQRWEGFDTPGNPARL